jgi:ABC-type transport system involved in cytochrome c biogenesis permease component
MLSVVINSSAMCLALAAGVLGSAWHKAWGGAILRAAILGLFFLLLMATVAGWGLASVLRSGRVSFWGSPVSAFFELEPSKWDYIFLTGIGFLANLSSGFAAFVFRTVTNGQLVWLSVIVITISLLGSLLTICLAGMKTGRVWQEPPPSPRQVWLEKAFCTPILWLSFFRAWMKRKLEKNPVGWLEQRTWSGRLLTWGWLAVIISLYSVMLTDPNFFRRSSVPQDLMASLLVLSMAITTAGSFRRERESGVLELLLVSPVGEHAIVWGRLRGLWGQFFPAVGLLLLVWIYLASLSLTTGGDGGSILFYAGTFVSFPIIGLYFSLRCRAFMTALLSALAMTLVVPMVVAGIVTFWMATHYGGVALTEIPFSLFAAIGVLVQAATASHCWRRLQERLKTRSFPLDRASA